MFHVEHSPAARRRFRAYDNPPRFPQEKLACHCAVDATPLWTRARERLVATSIGRLISLQLKRRRRFSPQRAPRSTWNTYSTARCSTWNMDTTKQVNLVELLPHLHKILRFAHSCALHSKLNGIILRPSLDSPKTKWDA